MVIKNFTQFNTATPLTTSDYVVGFKGDFTGELKTRISDIIQLVGETDNQTLSFNSSSGQLSISKGNTITLLSLATSSVDAQATTIVTANSANWNFAYAKAITLGTAATASHLSFAPYSHGSTHNHDGSDPVALVALARGLANIEDDSVALYYDPGDSNWAISNALAFRDALQLSSAATQAASNFAPSTLYRDVTGAWHSAYTIVQNNSASWEESADIIPITTFVQSNSSNWNKSVKSDISLESSSIGLSAIFNMVALTPQAYNNLTVKNSTTLYIIVSS